jgi:hypothetical protein
LSLALSICLVLPGVCDVPELDTYLEAVSVHRSAGEVERWRPLVSLYFPPDEVETALCIMGHESNGDPDADNPTSSARGLFQVLGSLWAPHYGVARADLYDPIINTRIAVDIWRDYGWRAWSPYQRGACR